MYVQSLILNLNEFWSNQGFPLLQPYDFPVGAGTFHPATALRAVLPAPWKAAYVQPSRRPADGHYGRHPFRLQQHYQYQVVAKPMPEDFRDLYEQSLGWLGLNTRDHELVFIDDTWGSKVLAASGRGWEVRLDGVEITQFTQFHQMGGIKTDLGEITYGIERLAMILQKCDNVFDLKWDAQYSYGDLHHEAEVQHSEYNFSAADCYSLEKQLNLYRVRMVRMVEELNMILPAYDLLLHSSHLFNLLDAHGGQSPDARDELEVCLANFARRIFKEYARTRDATES